MNRGKIFGVTAIAIILLGWGWTARAESARSLVAQGNTMYAAKRFDEAKKLYEEAAAKDPRSPEIQYDLGNARYKLDDFKGAAEAYQQATTLGRDPELVGMSEFNLGNTAFRQGKEAEPTDPEAAMKFFQQSGDHFRLALEAGFNEKAVGRNLEISRRQLQKVREELKRQQAAREEARQRQEEMAQELEQMAKEQQAMAGQSREQAGKPEPDQQAMDAEASAQQAMREKTEALRQKMGPPPEQEKAGQALDQAGQHQQEAVDKLREHQPEEAAKAQEEAAKAMREAQRSLAGQEQPREGDQQKQSPTGDRKEDQQAKKDQPQQDAPDQGAPPGGSDQKQKAADKEAASPSAAEAAAGTEEGKPVNRTAQELLNEERHNAIQRQSQGTTDDEAVDKDW